MDGRWEFYFLLVGDQPASIFVDLARIDHAPLAGFPVMAHVSVEMRQPREDGLSSAEEFDELVMLENTLIQALERAGDAIYVGRNTSSGRRDFYFYAREGIGWDARVAVEMARAPAYRYESGQCADAGWSVYREFLYPGPVELQRIGNRSVCDALEREGDDLEEAREIDHWAYFPDASRRNAFVADAVGLGYALRERHDSGDVEGEKFMARVFRKDAPAHAAIDDICLPLHDLAQEHDGRYDGWECEIVRANAAPLQ
ncbi:DUF695 domain-containing protein [Luteimonas aestuarii]|uniref:DUF695 domain-containing protein n=1 Tax=Luteimonas aestuarii TaxID=453837 RepID=A0A4R5TY81_9GAMM|nr:DUF695 domain-containing protein [Luteimonas aestuarii]TDK26111.1 DUF695 domain-containing protein [Luteimonas aestuarii]